LVLEAARILGPGTRVVSVPCTQRFERQTAEYRESVLPASCRRRVAVEAGVTGGWYRYVGLDGRVVGIDRFGMSAPAPVAFRELGLTVEAIVAAARAG
jgi:transketolase